jgi:hypothetical protein
VASLSQRRDVGCLGDPVRIRAHGTDTDPYDVRWEASSLAEFSCPFVENVIDGDTFFV